ncbi:MAG: transglutaminase domain-containing protein [Bacteroidetes bacterium]|nr:transglutaminase domain-containing protein [Bacteroidota bacterium]
MKVLKHISPSRFFASVLFLLLPTVMVIMFILWNSNQYFSVLQDQWFSQSLYVGAGMLLAFFIAQFRFRFLPLFAASIFVFYSIYQILDRYAVGELDSFFISVQFLIFSYLFMAGWLIGWGLQRIHFFPLLLSGFLLTLCIFLIAKTGGLFTPEKLLSYLTPVVLYSIYLMYTYEALRNTEHTHGIFWWRFSKRLIMFCATLLITLGILIYFMYPQIKERVEAYGGGAKDGENQMLENKKDGSVENKQSMGMGTNNSRNKNPEPLFCAHINSYLPGTEIPNPLYLTCWHFSKFDTLTETFERDTTLAFSDEFTPNPSSIQLFSTFVDSSRIENGLSRKNRKTIEIEIYKKRLSATAFLAPSTAFWVQPITVEKEYQQEFKYAYRTKSYVSDLNSAYFIYNSDNPEIKAFQQFRFEELRKAKGYTSVEPDFLKYYTHFPNARQYARIQMLADSLAEGKKTTIDKVLSIRDYFLQRNALGEKVYSYTDNPGIPGLPGSSNLMYFLFESKKGYCAYYAGATLFLLRAMKIPSRIVTGFLTVDRSDKNKGWYWFYEDQSHGWVQVYFPEYGWIDFDTTVGNDEAEQSPSPDGTPPMQPPNPVLALGGEILSVDTLQKSAKLLTYNLIFKDCEYKNMHDTLELNLQTANIWKDSLQVPITSLHKSEKIMAVSYSEKLKAFSPEKNSKQLLKKLPNTLPIDEVYIKDLKKDLAVKNKNNIENENKPLSYYLIVMSLIIGGIILLILLTPTLVYYYYKTRMRYSKSIKQKSYFMYRSSSLYLNQLGIQRNSLSAYKYASEIVDPQFDANYVKFILLYLKLKYSEQVLSVSETNFIHAFYSTFIERIHKQTKLGKRILGFLNINLLLQFYTLSEPEAATN